ncbi:20679_t:CDS:2 [Dentiscutata erythropus]|uniref:20679_t:CDS:1 n=1 Tax=Dentiscutata erythropus TaxID=1348616 RepID=A0A9N8ZFZ1_9GLOM|nr:20679_t:CDS:2 [Dentiscutata erythropus]
MIVEALSKNIALISSSFIGSQRDNVKIIAEVLGNKRDKCSLRQCTTIEFDSGKRFIRNSSMTKFE